MDSIKIEKMTAETVSAVAEIEKACFSKPWSLKSLESELENSCANFFTLEYDKKIVAYGGMHIVIDECYVDNIAVLPEFQGKGFGRMVTEFLVDTANKRECQFISLEVRPSNTKAVSLYKSLDFKEVGRRKNFYSSPTEDGLIMTKEFKN